MIVLIGSYTFGRIVFADDLTAQPSVFGEASEGPLLVATEFAFKAGETIVEGILLYADPGDCLGRVPENLKQALSVLKAQTQPVNSAIIFEGLNV